MTSPIQIPNLRPTDVVREPGLDQPQDQMSKLAQLLLLKGHLALQQEQFQAEEAQRKEKKSALANASTALSGIFNSPDVNTPGGMQTAYQRMLPILAGLGEPVGPAAAQLPGLQQASQQASTQSALGLAINEFAQGNVRDPGHQAEFLQHVMTISPGHMPQAAEMLKPLQTTIAYHAGPWGLWAGPATGTPADAQRDGRLLIGSTDPATKAKQSGDAAFLLQRIVNLQHALTSDSDAWTEPTTAAGAENIAKSGSLAAAVGALGALGIGAGTPEAIAQTKRSPSQQIWRLNSAGFVHTYLTFLGGGPRSNVLYEKIYNSFFPGAGASDEAKRNGWNDVKSIIPVMTAVSQGKPFDVKKLPFFDEAQQLEAQRGGAGQPAPGEGPPPITANDLLQGVPK